MDDLVRALAGSVLGWLALSIALAGSGMVLALTPLLHRRAPRGGAPLVWEWTLPGWSGVVMGSCIGATVLSGFLLLQEAWTAALGVWGGLGVALSGATWGMRRWYRRRLHRQVLPALVQLTALVSGSSSLLRAFRSVAQTAAWPLAHEWQWVDRQVGQAALLPDRTGQNRLQTITHADALAALAQATPDPLHAQVLAALATIYDSGGEGAAGVRLQALTTALTHAEEAQHAVLRAGRRVIGQAAIIVGAMSVVALWLVITQRTLVLQAFQESPLGGVALIWFVGWMAAPFGAAWWMTRPNEWSE
jgi:hypothetical protein